MLLNASGHVLVRGSSQWAGPGVCFRVDPVLGWLDLCPVWVRQASE